MTSRIDPAAAAGNADTSLLFCSKCGLLLPLSKPVWKCECGGYLLLRNPSMFSLNSLTQRPTGLWRYQEALGLKEDSERISLGEGWTQLATAVVDGAPIFLKMDFLSPTGSFKDRGSAVMLTKLKEWGITEVIEDSSGNAGASVAAYAAAAGIRANIFIPASTSAAKATQISMYGAKLVRVDGTREAASQRAWDAAKETFYASHNWSPFFLAGMKTLAYEIAEQLEWNAPDWVVVPVGGGSSLVGLYLGFRELMAHGMISVLPRLAAVQSVNCRPVYQAWLSRSGVVLEVQMKSTVAEGISIAKPVRGASILEAIMKSKGHCCAVDDRAIWESLSTLARRGIYVEPTSAAALAGLSDLRQKAVINPSERVVVVLTGSGLKATEQIVERFNDVTQ
jgi:threonine synthase